jgi:hypothetical protein
MKQQEKRLEWEARRAALAAPGADAGADAGSLTDEGKPCFPAPIEMHEGEDSGQARMSAADREEGIPQSAGQAAVPDPCVVGWVYMLHVLLLLSSWRPRCCSPPPPPSAPWRTPFGILCVLHVGRTPVGCGSRALQWSNQMAALV